MKKMLVRILLVAFILAPLMVEGRSGMYVTIESGYAQHSILSKPETLGALRYDNDQPSAYRIGLGYIHDFTCYYGLGLDLGYGIFAKHHYYYPENTTVEFYSRTVEVLVLNEFHVRRWDIFAKVGGIRNTANMLTGPCRGYKTKIATEVGVGLAYNFTPHFATTLSYAHVFGEYIYFLEPVYFNCYKDGLNEFLIGLRYSFC